MDLSVSRSLGCVSVVCEDSGENAALRWGKEGILPRHSIAMSLEEFPLRVRLDNKYEGEGESPGMTVTE